MKKGRNKEKILDKKVNDFRILLGGREYVPIMTGGMGVDISTSSLALEVARLGGIGHISDAMVPTVTDRRYSTKFVKNKLKKYKSNLQSSDKSMIYFDLEEVAEAQRIHVEKTMSAMSGNGAIFVNCMEKLTMNNPRGTLKARLLAAMDAEVDGISLSAGLHLNSMELMHEHPRFRKTLIGIIVSSVRALRPFLKRGARYDRKPDYIIVEGPLAGGHLGFGMNWKDNDLRTITMEVIDFLEEQSVNIPVLPAGGIFTGTDAVEFLMMGAAGVQVATRFTVSKECGLPDRIKQVYLSANENDVEVNTISPTGYPMRMLTQSPGIGAGIKPNCEAFGYILDKGGKCAYVDAYYEELAVNSVRPLIVKDKTCLCTHMRNFKIWTCGHYVYRLKDTTRKQEDGTYQLLSTEHVFQDYQYSNHHQISLPTPEEPQAFKILEVA